MAPWASLVGWLGVVFLIFGLLAALLQLLTGGLFWSRDQLWIWGNLGLGLAMLAVALLTNLDTLRDRLRSGEARRASRYGATAILNTALGIAILALLAFLATRYNERFDWTEARTHSLSEQTLGVLERLDRNVEITALYPSASTDRVRELVDRYARAEGVRATYADPQARPDVVRALGVAPERLEGGLVVVKLGEESIEIDELSEEKLTNALLRLTQREQKKVYFLEGHGERALEGEPSELPEGFAAATQALENENYEWEALPLAQRGAVPDDADVVIAAGPTRPLLELEIAALHAYLQRGGALLVMLDPRANTNLDEVVAEWGVELGDDYVVDLMQNLFGKPFSPFADRYGEHPITERLRETTLFEEVRSVQPKEGANGVFTVLAYTGSQSWAERDLEAPPDPGPDDLVGSVPVAVAGTLEFRAAPEPAAGEDSAEGAGEGEQEAEASPVTARLVVIGDSDFAANATLPQFRNRDFFLNSVNWLLGDVEAISIRPQPPRASRLQLSTEQFMRIRALSVFLLPELIAAAGVFAWWSRRRAPGR